MAVGLAGTAFTPSAHEQEPVIRVELGYRAPGGGPSPNFSPYGTQVNLTDAGASVPLPAGAARPAKRGMIQIGPDPRAWIAVLATASAAHPGDLVQIFLDRNRNQRFDDDGPAASAAPRQDDRTRVWWTSINHVELSIPYGRDSVTEPYLVSFWMTREPDAAPPSVLRYSVRSWRFGTATVQGVNALVAAMDANNDAVFDRNDKWSVLAAGAPDAPRAVLSHAEARPASRFMFLPRAGAELVLEFRAFSPDGRWIEFAVVDRPMTKAADRAADDALAVERGRPRTTTPFTWSHDYPAALAQARSSGKKLFIDFETVWCGPCKTMDEWIWTDADVAKLLHAGYIGVKVDGDLEKALVKDHRVGGYPTMIILDAAGAEIRRHVGYLASKEMIGFLSR
jgi:thiol-disulfide isomerase/thioredoxin